MSVLVARIEESDARSPGLEEYIEGLSFLHYLDKRELITLAEVQKTLSDSETGDPVSLTPRVYEKAHGSWFWSPQKTTS